MKYSIFMLIGSLAISSAAQAALQSFTCKMVMNNFLAHTISNCVVTVDTSDQSALSRPKPGSIDTSHYEGSFGIECDSNNNSVLGNHEKLAIFDDRDASDEIAAYTAQMNDPNYSSLGTLAFDLSAVKSMHRHAVPYSVEWMMYFIDEMKDSSGNLLGYGIEYNGMPVVGCLK